MKHTRCLFSVLMVVFLMAMPLSALAQDTTNPMCSGLSDEDCALMMEAQANLATATSFAIPAMEVSLNLNASPEESISVLLKGSGEIMLPTADNGLLLHLVLTDLAMEPSDSKVPEAAEIIVKDNMQFVNVDGQWYGEEMSEDDLASLQDTVGQVSGVAGSDLGALGVDMTGVVTVERGDDVEMMDMTMAHFKTSLDIGKLLIAVLSSPNLGALLGESGEDLGLGELSPEDMAMMGMFLTPMLAGTTLSVENWFGVDDQYLHKMVVDMQINIDMSMFGGEESVPITGAIYVDLELDQINETFEVEVPESYKPLEELDAELDALESLGAGL